jgi:hypothetical protein
VNHTRFPKEDHIPECASRDNQVKRGDRVEYIEKGIANIYTIFCLAVLS